MNGNMSASPIEFSYKDKTYKIYPMRDCDYNAFEIWLQDRYIEVTKRNVHGMDIDTQRHLLSAAFDKAALLTFTSPEALILMKTIEGSARIFHLSMRDAITLEEARTLATDPAFMLAAMKKIQLLSGSRVKALDDVKKKSTRKK